MKLSLTSPFDVQTHLKDWIRAQRKVHKLSRQALADRCGVPASTIKKFETTGQISLKQFILLWHYLDDLKRLDDLTKAVEKKPTTIDEVLKR